jgi:DNA-binding MarR family transcriptional regulator
MGTPAVPKSNQRAQPFARWRADATALIDEITAAAARIASARTPTGQPVVRVDGVWPVLKAVERSPYCLAIADLARVLKVRKQVAHEFAQAAVRAGYIELQPNHQDRRLLQAFVTPIGRNALAAARAAETDWLGGLLSGLGDRDIVYVAHVVRVIRQRLERDARAMARRGAIR